MTTSIERYHAAHSQFERDWILNDMPLSDFTYLVHEAEESIEKRCKQFCEEERPAYIFSFKDMRLFQRDIGIDVREKEFEIKIVGYVLKVVYDQAFGTYHISTVFPNEVSFCWEV